MKLTNIFSVIVFFGISWFLWNTVEIWHFRNTVVEKLRPDILAQAIAQEPHPKIRKRIQKLVFANLPPTSPQSFILKLGIEELSRNHSEVTAHIAAHEIGTQCLHIAFEKKDDTWKIASMKPFKINETADCFNDREFILKQISPFLLEKINIKQISIERQSVVSPSRLKVEGYAAGENLYQYSLTVSKRNFHWEMDEVRAFHF